MKKVFLVLIGVVMALPSWAAITLTASQVEVRDMTVDKPNFYFDITASTSQATYHVCLDVWPKTSSIIGTFSAADGTISRGFSSLRKGSNTYYYMYDDCPLELEIERISDDSCVLSAHFKAARSEGETRYEYFVPSFKFAYQSQKPEPVDDDPYRFEPKQAIEHAFEGQIVSVRDNRTETGWININLVDSAEQRLDWVELDLVVDSFAMPQGNFTFSADSAAGTMIASPGYHNRTDLPSYVALRGAEWGEADVYYIREGSLNFALNEKGDTVTVQGQVTSQNGSVFTIDVVAYNEFYVPPFPPKPKEEEELAIDSVVVTYVDENVDVDKNVYEFNFSYMEDYPNLIFNARLPEKNRLTEGTYEFVEATTSQGLIAARLNQQASCASPLRKTSHELFREGCKQQIDARNEIFGILLFRNQSDFNDYFFYGVNYNFVTVTMTLTDLGNEIWQYDLDLRDDVGSHFYFTFAQNPHLATPSGIADVSVDANNNARTYIDASGRVIIRKAGKTYNILGFPMATH